jgi:hypothetical protein
MINYIQHDAEFYGIIKLVSGEEILGTMIGTEEDGQTIIFVSNPAAPNHHTVHKETGEVGVAVGLIKWMMWSDESFFIINEADIMTIAPMSREAMIMYKMWVRKEYGSIEDDEFEIGINKNMGLVGKVAEARKRLERIFKTQSYDPNA